MGLSINDWSSKAINHKGNLVFSGDGKTLQSRPVLMDKFIQGVHGHIIIYMDIIYVKHGHLIYMDT